MPDPSGLYPQPPSQNNNPLGNINPLQLIPMMQEMQLRNIQIQREQGQLPATVQQPQAGLDLQRQQLQQEQLRQDLATSDALTGFFAPLANVDAPTAADVHDRATLAARAFRNVPANTINAFTDLILKDEKGGWRNPAGIKRALTLLQNQAAGPGAQIGRTAGPPDPLTGAPTSVPLGTANLTGAMPTGQPVGQEAVQGVAAASAARLEDTSRTSPQYHADLENLKQDSRVMENLGGPTAEVEKKLAQLSSRLGGLLPTTLSPEQLRAMESFDKIANQISASQAANLSAGTDAGRHMAVGMNPSTSMSAYGREGVIDMLQGNQDAIDATRRAWLGSGLPANQHNKWMNDFSKQFDPRVFQFNRLSRENQQKFLSQIDPEEYPGFIQRWNAAVARGWVKPLKTEKGASEQPPVAGARKATDGKWYVPDANRPGKYLMVQ